MFNQSVQQILECSGEPLGYTHDTTNEPGAEPKKRTGFASMDPELQRRIARKGGRARGRQMHEAAKIASGENK